MMESDINTYYDRVFCDIYERVFCDIPHGAGAILAVADKIDSLCGLMLVGEKATGSGDPYGLRRYALGVIRILNSRSASPKLRSINIRIDFGESYRKSLKDKN